MKEKKLIEVKNNILIIPYKPENCFIEKNLPKFYSEDEDYLFAVELQRQEEEEARKNTIQQTQLNTNHSTQNEKLPVFVTKENVKDLFTQVTPSSFYKQNIELEKENQHKLQEQENEILRRKLRELENEKLKREIQEQELELERKRKEKEKQKQKEKEKEKEKRKTT